MRHYDMYEYYDYGSSYNNTLDSIAWGLLMICTIVLIVWAIFSLGSYILRGIGMYTIAKRLGIDYAWLAFVPFARTYLHGELGGSILLKKKSIQNPGVWLLALPFLYGAVYSILYAILWFMGFGTIMKMDSYNYMNYNISTGNIMGTIVVFLILMVVSVAYTAFYKAFEVLVNHQILERFTSKNMSIVHGILCTIIPMYESICFFVMRNRPFNPGMEPPTPTPFMQSPPPGSYYDPSAQAGYPGSSMQGGYGNYGGTSAPSDANNYSNFSEQPTQAGTDYNSFGASSTQTGTDYNSFGTSSTQAGTDYNSFGASFTQAQNKENSFGASGNSVPEDTQNPSGILQNDAAASNISTTADSTGILKTEENTPDETKSE